MLNMIAVPQASELTHAAKCVYRFTVSLIKEIVHSRIIILSVFTHLHVIPNPFSKSNFQITEVIKSSFPFLDVEQRIKIKNKEENTEGNIDLSYLCMKACNCVTFVLIMSFVVCFSSASFQNVYMACICGTLLFLIHWLHLHLKQFFWTRFSWTGPEFLKCVLISEVRGHALLTKSSLSRTQAQSS